MTATTWPDGRTAMSGSVVALAGLHAGGVAAIVEMVPVLAIQAGALGVPIHRVLQAIASGLLGSQAYAGGNPAAMLGAGLHTLISIGAGLVFAFAASRLPILTRRPWLAGTIFGVACYLVMSFVVVPLSAAAFPPARNPVLIAISLAVHVVAFGIPIALSHRRALRRLAPVRD